MIVMPVRVRLVIEPAASHLATIAKTRTCGDPGQVRQAVATLLGRYAPGLLLAGEPFGWRAEVAEGAADHWRIITAGRAECSRSDGPVPLKDVSRNR